MSLSLTVLRRRAPADLSLQLAHPSASQVSVDDPTEKVLTISATVTAVILGAAGTLAYAILGSRR